MNETSSIPLRRLTQCPFSEGRDDQDFTPESEPRKLRRRTSPADVCPFRVFFVGFFFFCFFFFFFRAGAHLGGGESIAEASLSRSTTCCIGAISFVHSPSGNATAGLKGEPLASIQSK